MTNKPYTHSCPYVVIPFPDWPCDYTVSQNNHGAYVGAETLISRPTWTSAELNGKYSNTVYFNLWKHPTKSYIARVVLTFARCAFGHDKNMAMEYLQYVECWPWLFRLKGNALNESFRDHFKSFLSEISNVNRANIDQHICVCLLLKAWLNVRLEKALILHCWDNW